MPEAPDVQPGHESDADALERLLEAAAQLPADEREAYLDRECRDRPALKAEVLSLLAHAAAAEDFFARVDAHLPRSLSGLPDGESLDDEVAPGSRVGRYRVMERIGAGGMGTVYRAYDDALDRDVALKLVPRHLAVLPGVRARFLAEARAAASLDHANVCTIHEVGEGADGRPFLAMTCYRGETLRDRLERGPIPVDETLDIGIRIVRGLAAAHARGIVHRDIKPGNVMLVEDGSVKILDFGIAKVADVTTTGPGATPGTIAYMSPEQARGESVDARSDLWSAGVVLYEMLTGTRPFRGGRDGIVVDAILHDQPRPLEQAAPHVPPELARIVDTLLRKAPDERYDSAEQLLRDLERLAGGVAGSAPARGAARARGRAPGRLRLAAGVAAAVTVAAAGVALWPEGGANAGLDPAVVAVLPFRVSGSDGSLAYLREGMVDLLAHRLGSVEQLSPVDSHTLIRAWERAGGGDRDLSRAQALELAERLGAGRLVLGEVVTLPDRVVFTASLYDVAEGHAEASITEGGRLDSLAAVVDRLAVRLLSLEAGPIARLASITTGSLAALEPYLAGEAAYRRAQWDEAARAFARAVDHDSTFALAALMAARAIDKVGPGRIEGDFAARAWHHRDRLGPRERTYLEVFGPNFLGYSSPSALLASLQQLVTLLPDDPDAWFMLGERIPHSMARAGASDTLTLRHTAEAFRKGLALDSSYMIPLMQLQLTEAALGDTATAFRLARHYLERVPDGLESEKLRCVLRGASGAGNPRSPSFAAFGPAALGRCLVDLHGLYPYAHAARDTVADLLDRRSDSPEVMALAGPMMYTVALDRGRPEDARRYAAAFRQAGLGRWSDHVSSAIRDAFWADGDLASAAAAAAEIEDGLSRNDAGIPEAQRIEATCALGQWRAWSGDHAAATVLADRLRALGPTEETGPEVQARHCAVLLDAWIAFETGAADLEERMASLREMLIDGARDGRLLRESALLLARIHEARGQPRLALDALDRARFVRPATLYTAPYFRERGRFAAIIGDSAGARTAYRRYLAMRSAPAPAFRTEVDRIREELDRLGG